MQKLGHGPSECKSILGRGGPSCNQTIVLFLESGARCAFASPRVFPRAYYSNLPQFRRTSDWPCGRWRISLPRGVLAGLRGVGLLRSLLVRPRGPHEKQAPERGRMRAYATPSPRSQGAREGGVAGAVLKSKAQDQKIQETNATIKRGPPHLPAKIQIRV